MNKDNNEVLNMMAMSEEINSLNNKVQQLMRDLNGAGGVLGNIKELSDRLKFKVDAFNGNINKYEPPIIEMEDGVEPSYKVNGSKRERVFPTPNDKAYVVQEIVAPIVEVVEEIAIEDIPEEKPKQVVKQPIKKVVKKSATKKTTRRGKSLFGNKNVGIDKFSNTDKEGK